MHLTGVDISPRSLDRARRRSDRLGRDVTLEVADTQHLPYPDAGFDTVPATCVFCSVADPVQGLREVARVVRPTGRVLLYEHVRPRNPVLGKLSDLLSPLTRRLMGPELNRRTDDNVTAAGLRIAKIHRKGMWREIVAARKP